VEPADFDEICGLLYRYAERLDAGDFDGVAALFERATFRSSARPRPRRGRDQVRAVYDAVILHDGTPGTKHVISNVLIAGDGPAMATSRCYFTVLQGAGDRPLPPILAGRYHDQFERSDGGWSFRDRLVLPDLVGDLTAHLRRR
jgi:3-phenylpropionate/cinnamic acid dioxygenase small subunit